VTVIQGVILRGLRADFRRGVIGEIAHSSGARCKGRFPEPFRHQ